MRIFVVATLLCISLAGYSQTPIPDTSGIVTWTLKKHHRVKKQMTITIEGKIRDGYYIPPPERLDLGVWQNNKMTDIYFTADSNWIVNTYDDGGGIIGKTNKYKLWVRYAKDSVAREQREIVPVDTTIDGKKRHTNRNDTITVAKKEVLYEADCRVYGKLTMKRTISLSSSLQAKTRAGQEIQPPPSDRPETKKEEKKG
jgi:hypothetical protein